MVSAAGYRTGLYTSPHLESVEERLRLDGESIAPEELALLLREVLEASRREEDALPTYFEALTAVAFLWFAREKVDLAVVEVGMGGRLDATNLCDPVLSLITSISLEHREHLGNTLAAIACEKAGTFRPGRPALVWLEDPEPVGSVRAVAAELGTDLRFAPELVELRRIGPEVWGGQRVELATPRGGYDLWTALPGAHQARNLGLAVLAAETLAELGFQRLDSATIAAGAAACRWPGRLERVSLPGGRRVLLDAAHNAEGAAALGEALALLPGPVDLLFGVLADKDAADMLGRLAPRARRIVLTTPPNVRARRAEDLAALVAGRDGVEIEPVPVRALDRLLPAVGPAGATLVACGSIYLIGEVRRRLRERFGVPAPATAPLWPSRRRPT
jgi:dihydrofolate synthase / folylpolyglutamate synthase